MSAVIRPLLRVLRPTDVVPVPRAIPRVFDILGGAAFVGTPTYDLLLRMDGATPPGTSDVFTDDGDNGFTINWFTNDPTNAKGQYSTGAGGIVLFGNSAAEFFRGGGTPGHGGRDTNLQFGPVGTALDWGASPDLVIGGAFYPTFDSGDDDHCIFMLRRVVGHNLKLGYTDAGILNYTSLEGGVAKCDLDASEAFAYGEYNWFFLSMHGGVSSLWLGTDASGVATKVAEGADTSAYNMGSQGSTSASISVDPISSGGRMNAWIDHLFIARGMYIDGDGDLAVPTGQP